MTSKNENQNSPIIMIIAIVMVAVLFILSIAFFSIKFWKVSEAKNKLMKQNEKLQLELEQKKSNQNNDESYDGLYEDDQQGHHHHQQKMTTMAQNKKHNLAKTQLHSQEEANKEVVLSNAKRPSEVNEGDNSSNFYNYSIAHSSYVNYKN